MVVKNVINKVNNMHLHTQILKVGISKTQENRQTNQVTNLSIYEFELYFDCKGGWEAYY